MKQILLISRINPYKNEEEFLKYSDDKNCFVLPVSSTVIKLLIVKGSKLDKFDEPDEKAEEIIKIVCNKGLDKEEKTVVAYHFRHEIDSSIRSKFKENGWTNLIGVKRYSSLGDEAKQRIYEILNPLGKAIKSNKLNKSTTVDKLIEQLSEQLWYFISSDPILEAKLKLLQMIVGGETQISLDEKTKNFQLDNKIKIFQDDFDEFSKKDKDIFLVMQDAKISKEYKQQVFNEYKQAFEKFRDKLNIK